MPTAWLSRLSSIRYRELLDVPGIARAHDYQRAFSYSLGGMVVLTIGTDPWRVVFVAVVCTTLAYLAARRLVRGIQPPPLPLALVDLVMATVVVGVATGSPFITLLVPIIVGFAVIATFEVAVGPGVVLTGLLGLGSMGIAIVTSPDGSSSVSGTTLALVVVALLLVVAILILAFFTVQSYRLRLRLTSREAELSTVLSVTPVVLATIRPDHTLVAVGGHDSLWLGRPGDYVPEPVRPLVTEAGAGRKVERDIDVGTRTFQITCIRGGSQSVLLTAVDITEREYHRRRLEELIQSKDSFVAAISHELRTPLTAVLGFAQEARSHAGADEFLRPLLDVIAEQSTEMAAIIEDLLVAARADQGSITVLRQELDLADEIEAVMLALEGRVSETARYDIQAIPVIGDRVRIRQVLRNLVTNADRYGGDRLLIRTAVDQNRAVVEVCDDGPPVAQPLREKIFEPYASSGTVAGQPAALGLGLAVSRRLADLMGGELSYHHANGWSVFRLSLPAAVAAEV